MVGDSIPIFGEKFSEFLLLLNNTSQRAYFGVNVENNFRNIESHLSFFKVRFLKVRGVRATITESHYEIIKEANLKTYGVSFFA